MSAEEFFTDVVLCYKRLLLSSAESVPGFRAYCRSRHVAFREFTKWASADDLATSLLRVERQKKRSEKDSRSGVKICSPVPEGKEAASGKPLLYPLHIITGPADRDAGQVERSVKLRDVCVSFPNGVKVSVREADSSGICSLVHGVK